MARVLIVGCGCRGRQLAGALAARGHAVRGSTRREQGRAAIEAAGIDAVVADPDRLATLTPHLEGVSALCWLMGSATGERDAVAALHGPRLASMVEALVDTPVRGVVYEAAGTVDPALLGAGAEIVRRIAATHSMPAELVHTGPQAGTAWTEQAAAAVDRVLAA